MFPMAFFTCAETSEVPARLLQAESVIWTASNASGILIVSPVVLPETDRTDLVSATLIESEKPTTGARESDVKLRPSHVLTRCRVFWYWLRLVAHGLSGQRTRSPAAARGDTQPSGVA